MNQRGVGLLTWANSRRLQSLAGCQQNFTKTWRQHMQRAEKAMKAHDAPPHSTSIPASSPGHLISQPSDQNPTIYTGIDYPHSMTISLMASLKEPLPLAFLLFLASSLLQTHARESLFFSKASRFTAPDRATPLPVPAINGEEPATLPPQSYNGYGLYGHGLDDLSIAANSDYNKYDGVHARDFTSSSDGENNNANHFPSDEFNSGTFERREPTKPESPSDTRFFEKGRYFYDVNAENGYESSTRVPEEHRSKNRVGARGGGYYNYGGYSYGGTGNDNGTVEHENRQEVVQEGSEDYVP